MRRRTLFIVLGVVAALVAAGVPAGLAYKRQQERSQKDQAAEAFADAWRGGTLQNIRYAGDKAPEVAQRTQTITAGLTAAEKDAPASVEVDKVTTTDDGTTAQLNVSWTLSGGRAWRYTSTLPLRHQAGEWLPDWQPQVLHPRLAEGQVLTATRQRAPRAAIIGARDEPLVTERPVVVVGLEPRRAGDVEAAAKAVADVVDVDADDLAKRAAKAVPTAFVEVITLRRDDYDAVRDRLRPIRGTVFQEEQRALAPNAQFARALLGSVGTATAEVVKESDGRVRAGDVTGLSGLQRSYDEQLAGQPGIVVRAVTPESATAQEGSESATGEQQSGEQQAGEQESQGTEGTEEEAAEDVVDGAGTAKAADATLLSEDPKPGTPLRVTIDRPVQEAAEKALERATKPAALVAIRAGTGEVLAVANGGPNASGYNRALLGRYPPGSTFKVVSTFAMLRDGLSPDETVDCPPKIVVSGKTFVNAEDEVLGPVPFRSDFAHSCNTAFVRSAERIDGKQLKEAATALGYGRENTLGTTAFTGSVPDTDDPVGHAAAVIGQGKVLASPLAVAGVSASIAGGRWTPPKLVVEPAPDAARPAEGQLDAGTVGALREMMRAVVTEGTATVLKSTPGGPVSGKTGTAEYGRGDPPPTHAWFSGFQGDVAFAVVVEDGGFGAKTAAPVAGDFLERLAR